MSKEKLLTLIESSENNFNELYASIAIFGLVTNESVQEEASKIQELLDKVSLDDLKELVKQL